MPIRVKFKVKRLLPPVQKQDPTSKKQRTITHAPAVMPSILNKENKEKKGHKYIPWDQRFHELVDFKKINGHTKVPLAHGPLGVWVKTQTQYSNWNRGKASCLTREKRLKLESIGFSFSCRTCKPWDQQFQELLEFKNINGHDNVPLKSGPLGAWVSRQRRFYRLSKEGKDSPLTSDRRQKLESIEFGFSCNTILRLTTPAISSYWDQQSEELLRLKRINGYLNVSYSRTISQVDEGVPRDSH